MCLMSWGIACKDKRNEGLRMKKLDVFNKALLRKWLSRHALEHDSPWRKIIQGKYGEVKWLVYFRSKRIFWYEVMESN